MFTFRAWRNIYALSIVLYVVLLKTTLVYKIVSTYVSAHVESWWCLHPVIEIYLSTTVTDDRWERHSVYC